MSGARATAILLALVVGVRAAPVLAASLGAVTGTIRLDGPAPARPLLPVYKHHEVCGSGVTDDRLVVGPGGGVRFAVVSVEGVRGGAKPERDATVVLDNRACHFEPHVQVAEIGQWLELRNSDPILHNADARIGADTLFNVALWPNRHVRKPLARTGLISVTCDVRHTWMRAYIAVGADPYHAVTDMYGAYDIRDIPPGSYTLRVWHEELGTVERPLVIVGGQSTTIDLALPPPAAPAAPPGADEHPGTEEHSGTEEHR